MQEISLYIPCHNAERFIMGCIESVLRQSLLPIEVIVVNDGSTDRTVDIARKFPVRVIDLPFHSGLAAARNVALEAAKSDCVASLDADCRPYPLWLERLLRALDEERAAGSGGRLEERYHEKLADRWRAVHMRQNWGATRIVNPPFLFGCNTLFRKSALKEVGMYDARFTSNGEDVDISHRLLARGHSLVYEPTAVVLHLKRDTILSVLRADWNWGYLTSGDTFKYESTANIVYHNFTNAKYRFIQDARKGHYGLLPLDALLLLCHSYWDIRYARKIGLHSRLSARPAPRVEALTCFHACLSRLSEKRFLRNPDSTGS